MSTTAARAVLGLILILASLGAVAMASSLAAQNTAVRVMGGAGTFADPLQIEVSGDVGLAAMIDSLIPYRAIPGMDMYYRHLSFSIPDMNRYFVGRPWLGFACLLVSLLLAFIAVTWTVLAACGKRLLIVSR